MDKLNAFERQLVAADGEKCGLVERVSKGKMMEAKLAEEKKWLKKAVEESELRATEGEMQRRSLEGEVQRLQSVLR